MSGKAGWVGYRIVPALPFEAQLCNPFLCVCLCVRNPRFRSPRVPWSEISVTQDQSLMWGAKKEVSTVEAGVCMDVQR